MFKFCINYLLSDSKKRINAKIKCNKAWFNRVCRNAKEIGQKDYITKTLYSDMTRILETKNNEKERLIDWVVFYAVSAIFQP